MEVKNHKKITGGVYLVIDPAMNRAVLLSKLASALQGKLEAVQLWNNWTPGDDKLQCIEAVGQLCRQHNVPLLIDNDWELLLQSPYLDGIHFDAIPADYALIKQKIDKLFIAGITCQGNLDVVRWADENLLDYVSFCAMFPSPSAGSCDIVMPATVRQAKSMTGLPLFVSGGITPANMTMLRQQTPFDGVAVISGIMSADDPLSKVKLYHNALTENISKS
ncbi:thiamine phosphate synthase [Mucilaginibacter sp. CSA2-8R]|uniref:thiamine phosphate synthase n=1 Tax=Mucilaginibacter sp. CSA2-8R TaxID=3141542 RepID=UPI00315D84CD